MHAMITVTIQVPNVTEAIDKILAPEVQDKMLMEAATVQVSMMAQRIHIDGKDSFDKPIGTYSDAYMRVRTGIYNDYKVRKTGKDIGLVTSSGVFTKGKNKGKARPRYNRSIDRKVILSLTRQMENDLSIQELPSGWGVGYNNPFNYEKATWLQDDTYDKPIWLQSADEETAVKNRILKYIDDAIRG